MASTEVEFSEGVRQYLLDSVRQSKVCEQSDPNPEDRLTQLLPVLSSPPMYTTLRINTLKYTVIDAKAKVCQELTKQYTSRGWAPPEVHTHLEIPELLVVPSSEIIVEPLPSEVIVDMACGMAVLRGADVFAQGILAAPPVLSVGDHVSVYADLDAQCRKGLTKTYTGRKRLVGNGVAMVTREQLFCGDNKISGVGIQMTDPLYRAPGLDQLPDDLVFAQNLPSVMCSRVLGPLPGDTVLDMCAAPGGKTTHLASLMNNEGRLVAFDKSKNKISRITDNCEKCGVSIVEAHHYDGTKSVDLKAAPEGDPPYPPTTFDLVLLDAPCSALGQRPVLRNRAKLSEVKSYQPLQRKLFSKAVSLLKPGGHLVYSTCTITTEENENLVAWALKEHTSVRLVPQTPHLGGPGWKCEGLTDEQSRLLQRFDPSRDRISSKHEAGVVKSSDASSGDALNWNDVNTDTICFFIAKFQKIADCDER